MFEAHGWNAPGNKMMTSAPTLIVQDYGSIREFEDRHKHGDLMFPMEAIKTDPANVWLTSFYGFGPWNWGFLGFTEEWRRDSFLRDTKPGILIVVYGASKAIGTERGKILGILQCSHEIGDAQKYMAPDAWNEKQADPERRDKWNHGVRVTRAWQITPETRISVREFAPDATETEAWQHIGASGVRLSRQEAERILKLDLQEVEVYGGTPIIDSAVGQAKEILAPSKAGPVSQSPFVTRESEGPKHLYILKLEGDTDAFLGEAANDKMIVKAGFSRSPQSRCGDFNRALPRCAFHWEVLHCGPSSGLDAYPTSDHAKAGEREMQTVLCRTPGGHSLGGEFFLATPELIADAWKAGNISARDFKT
nr:hypothetical protein [uncultured Roseibium sp.]